MLFAVKNCLVTVVCIIAGELKSIFSEVIEKFTGKPVFSIESNEFHSPSLPCRTRKPLLYCSPPPNKYNFYHTINLFFLLCPTPMLQLGKKVYMFCIGIVNTNC